MTTFAHIRARRLFHRVEFLDERGIHGAGLAGRPFLRVRLQGRSRLLVFQLLRGRNFETTSLLTQRAGEHVGYLRLLDQVSREAALLFGRHYVG